ncbi:MAG: sensor histidine kinase, partial [Acidimicrobiales bacterium]
VPLQRAPFAVAEVLEQAAAEARLHGSGVEVVVDIAPESLTAEADAERVHQVVANLLENALRYSPTEGRVTLLARQRGTALVMEVADEGPGIPEEEVGMVFERFYRADASRSSSHGGAGLGLAISRWIVDLHGGEIRVVAGQARGCRIVVVLPEAVTSPVDAVPPVSQVAGS